MNLFGAIYRLEKLIEVASLDTKVAKPWFNIGTMLSEQIGVVAALTLGAPCVQEPTLGGHGVEITPFLKDWTPEQAN